MLKLDPTTHPTDISLDLCTQANTAAANPHTHVQWMGRPTHIHTSPAGLDECSRLAAGKELIDHLSVIDIDYIHGNSASQSKQPVVYFVQV